MIEDRTGYVYGGAFILVAVGKYVINTCFYFASYSNKKSICSMKLCENIISRN